MISDKSKICAWNKTMQYERMDSWVWAQHASEYLSKALHLFGNWMETFPAT